MQGHREPCFTWLHRLPWAGSHIPLLPQVPASELASSGQAWKSHRHGPEHELKRGLSHPLFMPRSCLTPHSPLSSTGGRVAALQHQPTGGCCSLMASLCSFPGAPCCVTSRTPCPPNSAASSGWLPHSPLPRSVPLPGLAPLPGSAPLPASAPLAKSVPLAQSTRPSHTAPTSRSLCTSNICVSKNALMKGRSRGAVPSSTQSFISVAVRRPPEMLVMK